MKPWTPSKIVLRWRWHRFTFHHLGFWSCAILPSHSACQARSCHQCWCLMKGALLWEIPPCIHNESQYDTTWQNATQHDKMQHNIEWHSKRHSFLVLFFHAITACFFFVFVVWTPKRHNRKLQAVSAICVTCEVQYVVFYGVRITVRGPVWFAVVCHVCGTRGARGHAACARALPG